MSPSSILETVLYAEDLDAAEQFYTGILGLEKVARAGIRHLFLRCGEQMLLIFNPYETIKLPVRGALPVPPHGAIGSCHVCFRASSADIDHWRAKLTELDVIIDGDFEWPQGGRSLYFRDPASNSVEFAEPRIWGLS